MAFIAFLLLLSFAPIREMIRLSKKNYYNYEKQFVLQSSTQIDTYSDANPNSSNTLSAGTVIYSSLINNYGELMNCYYVNDKGEHIYFYNRIPADNFKEVGLIRNDLALLLKDKENQISNERTIVFVFSLVSLALSCITVAITVKIGVKRRTYNIVYSILAFVIINLILVYLVGLFLAK